MRHHDPSSEINVILPITVQFYPASKNFNFPSLQVSLKRLLHEIVLNRFLFLLKEDERIYCNSAYSSKQSTYQILMLKKLRKGEARIT